MESISGRTLAAFFEQLGKRYSAPADVYLLGGSALLLLGGPRETIDIDYLYSTSSGEEQFFKDQVEKIALEMKLDLEFVPIGEFIPLPEGAFERRKLVLRSGQIDVYIFDLYSIALSKIARGFESDFEDVLFLLEQKMIDFSQLEQYFEQILPLSGQADIIPSEFEAYFEELRRKWVEKKGD